MTKNGSASYVGSMNFISKKPTKDNLNFYLGKGSFNSNKFSVNSEKIWENGGIYISLSDIKSDGYKNHSSNSSKSSFFILNQNLNKNKFKLVGFIGNQKNQLSWLGVPLDIINKNRRYNANLENEIDDFNQMHFQFHYSYNINNVSNFNYNIYYNKLEGYYTYNYDGLKGIDLSSNFMGANIYFDRKFNNLDLISGVNIFKYNRKHSDETPLSLGTYHNIGYRDDIMAFFKASYKWNNFSFYGDIQYRNTIFIYNDSYVEKEIFNYNFINFISGINYKKNNNIFYYSIGSTNREPIRNDIFGGSDHLSVEDVLFNDLKPEQVLDQELGYKYIDKNKIININLFYMSFNNELVLTGEYGETGLPLHLNVDNSYRAGVEGDFKYVFKNFELEQNFSYICSEVSIFDKKYTPVLSPKIIINTLLNYNYKMINIGINGKYQDYSYIETSNKYTIPSYYNINLRIGVKFNRSELFLYLNNITNQEYLTNGMLGYNEEPLYFVGAPFNIFGGIKIKI